MTQMIQKKADAVAKTLNEARITGFDIGSIVELINLLMGLFKDCFGPQEALERFKKLSEGKAYPGHNFHRLRLRTLVRRHARTGDDCTPEDVEGALIDVAGGLKLAEVKTLFAEAREVPEAAAHPAGPPPMAPPG